MKRSLLVGCISSLAILPAFAACGNPSILPDGGSAICTGDYLDKPAQACPDRASLGFSREFGSGTYIGQKPQDNIAIRNGGIADLTITGAALTSGSDPAFTLTTEPPALPAVIKGNKTFFMRVVFAPTQPRLYTGKIVVQSNAAKSPTLEFEVSGCGVPGPGDGGTSPCYLDGGLP